jgi:hypothetical protein
MAVSFPSSFLGQVFRTTKTNSSCPIATGCSITRNAYSSESNIDKDRASDAQDEFLPQEATTS